MLAAGCVLPLCLAALCAPASAARLSPGSRPPPRVALPPEVLQRATALLPPTLVHALSGCSRTARVWPSSVAAPGWTASRLVCEDDLHQTLFLPGGELLVTTHWDGGYATSTAWSMSSRSKGATFRRWCPSEFLGVSRAFPDGERVVGLSAERERSALVVWNATSGVPAQWFDLNGTIGGTFLEVRVLHPGDRMVIASSWGAHTAVVVVNASSGRQLHSLRHDGSVLCMEVSPCGGKVVTAGNGGLFLWNAATGALDLHVGVQVTRRRPRVAVSRGGARLFANVGGSIMVWEGGTGRLSRTISVYADDFVLLPDGRRLVVVSDMSATVWDIQAGLMLQTLRGFHYGNFRGFSRLTLALSASGDAMAICSTLQRRVSDDSDDEEPFWNWWTEADEDIGVVEYAVDYTAQMWDLASGSSLYIYEETVGLQRSRDAEPPLCSVAVFSVSQQIWESFAGY